ncbi:hypothetical protein PoB_002910500 [Plakobranchus ocellatus]|uniref:Uncharacterized protein n=1 Tax=Plakobranchus ocellatus TaxID=259542 RepID=A0AAV4A5E4_9GAST|nr:hypothetical protein PoB_002910500 [Plakobranchus ocellatus]
MRQGVSDDTAYDAARKAMANYLIMPYDKNNRDLTPGSPMLGLSVNKQMLMKTLPSLFVAPVMFLWRVALRGHKLRRLVTAAPDTISQDGRDLSSAGRLRPGLLHHCHQGQRRR